MLSLDGFYDFNKDTVILSLAGAPKNIFWSADRNNVAADADCDTLRQYGLSGGRQRHCRQAFSFMPVFKWMQFAPPSDPFTVAGTGFTDIGGDFVCVACNTAIGKILTMSRVGARFAVTETVDGVGACYHETQNDFAANPANVKACATLPASKNNPCAGTVDAASALIGWKFAPKWDTYIGTFFNQFNGGLNNGFLSRNNLAATAGLRFRF
jgi:hypothetical protein